MIHLTKTFRLNFGREKQLNYNGSESYFAPFSVTLKSKQFWFNLMDSKTADCKTVMREIISTVMNPI